MNSKTILIVSANYFTLVRFRFTLISNLLNKGYTVVVYAFNDDMSQNAIQSLMNIGAICYACKGNRNSLSIVNSIQYISNFRNILKSHNPILTINFTIKPMIFGGAVCRLMGFDYISVITGLGRQFYGSLIRRRLLRIAYSYTVNHSKQIWYVSQTDALLGSDKLNLDKEKSRVVYGAGVDIFPIKDIKKYNKKHVKILYMGRISIDKGIKDFIKITDLIVDLNNDRFQLYLMGDIDRPDKYIESFLNKIENLKCVNRVEFTHNNLQILRQSDVLLMCSRHEGMPTIILESMSNLVIPLAANLPVIDELNNMGAHIFTYVPGNIQSLYKEILRIEELPLKERVDIKNRNYNFVCKYFEKSSVAKIQYQCISELIKK